jgi:hypothetical protein
MLTEKEKNELSTLSPKLKDRILLIFESPYVVGYEALYSQFMAYCNELKNKPFTIDGDEDYSKYQDSENVDKIINALSSTNRAKAETSLKISKEIPDMADKIVMLHNKLTDKEKEAVKNKKSEKSKTLAI